MHKEPTGELVFSGPAELQIAFDALLLNGLWPLADIYSRARAAIEEAVEEGRATQEELDEFKNRYFAEMHGPAIRDGHTLKDAIYQSKLMAARLKDAGRSDSEIAEALAEIRATIGKPSSELIVLGLHAMRAAGMGEDGAVLDARVVKISAMLADLGELPSKPSDPSAPTEPST